MRLPQEITGVEVGLLFVARRRVPVPQRRGPWTKAIAALDCLLDESCQRVLAVRPVVHRQIAGALRVEDEQRPEHQCESYAFELFTRGVNRSFLTSRSRPPAEDAAESRQDRLPNGFVEAAT